MKIRLPDLPFRQFAVLAILASLATGCASLGAKSECPCPTDANAASDQQKSSGLSEQRSMLSEGYSMLYWAASKLEHSDLVLYVKSESDAVEEMVTAVARFGGAVKKDLEQIARDYPGVRINLEPLPDMEMRTRVALSKDRALEFAPAIGTGGRDYERTMLIAFSGGLNHERYLCQVMADEEPDAGLKKFLLVTCKGYDDLYDRTLALLSKDYFRRPEGKTSKP